VKVGHCEQVGGTEGLADIALALDLTHLQRVPTNIVGALHQGFG
jgi:hypothetical protein